MGYCRCLQNWGNPKMIDFLTRNDTFGMILRNHHKWLLELGLPERATPSSPVTDGCQVTVNLVEEYIRPKEMVILCVIPAMSDFGNAEAGCGSSQLDGARVCLKSTQVLRILVDVVLCKSQLSKTISLAFVQVVKLVRKHDPDGIRTLGVVTKCDDAANAEASDIVKKVRRFFSPLHGQCWM